MRAFARAVLPPLMRIAEIVTAALLLLGATVGTAA